VGKLGICRSCDEWGWITDMRGYCVDCVNDRPESNRALDHLTQSLAMVQERMSEYVLSTDIPLQLIKEERELKRRIASIKQQLSLDEGGPDVLPS